MLTPPLTDIDVRVLGALIEKEATTPDNYPLSISALLAACNQLSNREPVMQLDEATVMQSIVSLRRRSLLRAIQPSGARVTKYMHLLHEALLLDARELAVLGVLMLRGEQTPGELHARTARLAEFADLAAIEAVLDGLMSRTPEALVTRLPRRAGQKEVRYAQLLAGEVLHTVPAEGSPEGATDAPASARTLPADVTSDDRVAALERGIATLRDELAALRAQFDDFRAQFQ
ncbi:MAG: YceH family protein [Gemmatimonadaceae bacterium]